MRTYVAPDELEGNKLLKETYKDKPIGVVYQGVVRDNKDPQNLGRVRVYIPEFYNGMSVDSLPWAQPCLFSASYESGTFIIPKVGNVVWVLFENNDKFKPVYIGSKYIANSDRVKVSGDRVQSARTSAVPLIALDSDNQLLFKADNGSSIYFDKDGIKIVTSEGSGISIDSDSVDMINKSGSRIYIENNKLILDYEKTKISLDGNNIDIISGESVIALKSSGIKIDSKGSTVNISDSIKISKGATEANIGNNSVTLVSGNTRIRQTGSVIDVSASTVNINADYINM